MHLGGKLVAQRCVWPARAAMTDPDQTLPYHVVPKHDRFEVLDWEGNVLIATSTSANADQYAALLNQAYRRGYKAGFRNAKRPS